MKRRTLLKFLFSVPFIAGVPFIAEAVRKPSPITGTEIIAYGSNVSEKTILLRVNKTLTDSELYNEMKKHIFRQEFAGIDVYENNKIREKYVRFLTLGEITEDAMFQQ